MRARLYVIALSNPAAAALELAGGRRVQGSLAIPRVLDELIVERPLYPSARAARRAVDQAQAGKDLARVPALLDRVDVGDRPCAAKARRLFPTSDRPSPSTPQLSDGSAGIVESSR